VALVLSGQLRRSLGLCGLVGGTFIVFSDPKWQIFGSRLQLPFFLLIAPFVGATAGRTPQPGTQLAGRERRRGGLAWMTGIPAVVDNRVPIGAFCFGPGHSLYFTTGASSRLSIHDGEISPMDVPGRIMRAGTVSIPLGSLDAPDRISGGVVVANELGTTGSSGFSPAPRSARLSQETHEIFGLHHAVFDDFTLY
jgi:hypothetical protein